MRYWIFIGLAIATLLVSRAVAVSASDSDIFPSIPEVRSVHGVVSVEFYAELDPIHSAPTLEYNGLPGPLPTIRVHPGDTILMTVHNDMPSTPAQRNAVNIHFHGMEVSPNPPGDEVIMTLALRGQTLHYRVKIPANHEPGLYWYHPHSHGESYREVTNGMSGAIVVEGLQDHFPALAAMRERIIVLRDVSLGRGFVDEDMPISSMAQMQMPPASNGTARKAVNQDPCRPEAGLQPTLNREPRARIGIAPGERQFFRVVNASAGRYFDLSIDGSPLQLVAQDGVPLDVYPGNPPSIVVSHLVLSLSSRGPAVRRFFAPLVSIAERRAIPIPLSCSRISSIQTPRPTAPRPCRSCRSRSKPVCHWRATGWRSQSLRPLHGAPCASPKTAMDSISTARHSR
jgi:hypothetical protein